MFLIKSAMFPVSAYLVWDELKLFSKTNSRGGNGGLIGRGNLHGEIR